MYECAHEYVKAGYIQFDEEKQVLKLLNLTAKKFKKILPKTDSWIPYPFYDWIFEVYPQYNRKSFMMYTIHFPTSQLNIIAKVLCDELLDDEEMKQLKSRVM